ncbi:MAG: PspA/IM30 family protein [Erythrobacter sp.]
MLRIAVQIRELVSSNVGSAIEAASDPAKTLRNLQREIEEAIISLQGDRTKTARRKTELEAAHERTVDRIEDWTGKAKTAMDHDREDLARQALMAREDCREQLARAEDEVAQTSAQLAEIENAILELEKKREEVREKVRVHSDGEPLRSDKRARPSAANRQLHRITAMARRAEFSSADWDACGNPSVEHDIDDLRLERTIDAEIEKLKGETSKSAAKRRHKKAG